MFFNAVNMFQRCSCFAYTHSNITFFNDIKKCKSCKWFNWFSRWIPDVYALGRNILPRLVCTVRMRLDNFSEQTLAHNSHASDPNYLGEIINDRITYLALNFSKHYFLARWTRKHVSVRLWIATTIVFRSVSADTWVDSASTTRRPVEHAS